MMETFISKTFVHELLWTSAMACCIWKAQGFLLLWEKSSFLWKVLAQSKEMN